MERMNENDALFTVRHRTTQDKLLKLEKGVRKVGFESSGRKFMLTLMVVAVCSLIGALFAGGVFKGVLTAVGGISFIAVVFCFYTLINGWFTAKREIRQKMESEEGSDQYEWEYFFYDKCYEAVGKNETARINYEYLGRLMDFSGLLVLVERGNVVRFFMKDDVADGKGDELAEFLEKKSRLRIEPVRV